MLAAAFYLLDVLKIERTADVNGACRHVTSVVPQAISTAVRIELPGVFEIIIVLNMT